MRSIYCLVYGVGHVLNDLSASLWFTYTLVFLQSGMQLSSQVVWTIIFISQIADAVATVIVGMGADLSHSISLLNLPPKGLLGKLTTWLPKSRLIWHFNGSLLILLTLPFIFSPIFGYQNAHVWAKAIYYIPFIVIFQFGWAAVQVSHLTLLNDLPEDRSERVFLTSLRYFFSVLSNMIVYIACLILPRFTSSSNRISGQPNADIICFNFNNLTLQDKGANNLTETQVHNDDCFEKIVFFFNDVSIFQILAYVLVGVGVILTIIFHLVIGSNKKSNINNITIDDDNELFDQADLLIPTHSSNSDEPLIFNGTDWFKVSLFWISGFIYTINSLIIKISQVYILYYILISLMVPELKMSIVPLIVYITSMLTSIVHKPFHKFLNTETCCFVGLIFISGFCLLIHVSGALPSILRIFIGCVCLGIGLNTLLVASLVMVGDLVEWNTSTSAFVYGMISFADKLVAGIIIETIQLLKPFRHDSSISQLYYRSPDSYIIGGLLLFAAFLLFLRLIVRKINLSLSAIIRENP